MKKRIVNILMALLFTASIGLASNTPSIKIDGTKAIIVDAQVWKSKLLNVDIKDQNGVTIYGGELTMDNAKKFSFQNLPEGKYTVTLADEFKTTTQEFIINENRLELTADVTTTYKPVIIVEDDYIDVNHLSKGDKTSISIYDSKKNAFHVKIKDEMAISKRFNISQLPAGKYTISVNTGGESYWQTFKK